MPATSNLEQRLIDIGRSLASTGQAYALLGLGSAGLEAARMDEYSDLDFFAIVKEGQKRNFIDHLDWLSTISPLGYAFRNTADGYKALYEDGIFCEFAVFEPHELADIPFSAGRVVWSQPEFNTDCLNPSNNAGRYQRSDNIEWIIGEAVTNLYVGLCRFHRGERLSAMKFVQSFSVDRILDLLHIQQPASDFEDQYMPDRRLEFRFPMSEPLMATFCQGYQHTPDSAVAQLTWLQKNFEVNSCIAREIRRLAALTK